MIATNERGEVIKDIYKAEYHPRKHSWMVTRFGVVVDRDLTEENAKRYANNLNGKRAAS